MGPIITFSRKSATRTRRGIVFSFFGAAIALAGFMLGAGQVYGAEAIGLVKTSKGVVVIERGGQKVSAAAGTALFQSDTLTTGEDGSVGMTFIDNSRVSLGANSALSLEKFRFNTTTHEGEFVSALNRGALAAVSGKIAKATPEAMKVRTPSAILGVRGTKFLVSVGNR